MLLFALIHLPSGGPADVYAANPLATPADIEQIKLLWGLNEPLHTQYFQWLTNAVSGNWGWSFSEKRPVVDVVFGRLPNTLLLTGGALLFALLVGLPLGLIGAASSRAWVRNLVQGVAVLGMSVPTFWSGALVLLFFSVYLRWIPPGGITTPGAPFSVPDLLFHLAAPVIVLGSVYVAQWSRYVQAGLTEVLREDYIRVAQAKGVGKLKIILRHGLPNAAIPLITVLGLEMPRVLSGAVVTEAIFSWPGLGRLLTDSLLARDYPVVMGVLMLLTLAVMISNLLADLAYGWADPRIRYD